jgi:hypothetical protein
MHCKRCQLTAQGHMTSVFYTHYFFKPTTRFAQVSKAMLRPSFGQVSEALPTRLSTYAYGNSVYLSLALRASESQRRVNPVSFYLSN